MGHRLFTVFDDELPWSVEGEDRADVQHEVFFEDRVTEIRHRPMFLGDPIAQRKYLAAFVVLGVLLFGLVSRAFTLQIMQGKTYQELADNNRLRDVPIWPKRGVIRDRNGVVLADNISRFQVIASPYALPLDEHEREEVIARAARLFGVSLDAMRDQLMENGRWLDEDVVVANGIPYDKAIAAEIEMPHLTGFRLEVRPTRRYPLSSEVPSLSHILGYVGKISPEEYTQKRDSGYLRTDEIGKTGLERMYENEMRGTLGWEHIEVDAFGKENSSVGVQKSVDGTPLQLTLDTELQRAAEEALRAGLERAKVQRGAVIALDPRDGSVLAAVSLPSYDNTLFTANGSSTLQAALFQDDDRPLFPRAWAGTYPSGSTVKIVISVAALMEHIVDAKTTVLSTGGIQAGPWFFPDWKAGGHGTVNVRSAIAWSVNTFFYYVGGGYNSFVGMGSDKLAEWMRRFGLGTETGLDVPSEATGLVPTKEWKVATKKEAWYLGDTYNLSIGQGDLLVTPMQVAVYTSAIANNGTIVRPHFLKSFGEGAQASGTSIFSPKASAIADQSALETVRLGMRDAVVYGSARSLSTLPFEVAGKTGTAQWHPTKNTHAWFTGFAPFENPEIVVSVLIEEGGEGSSFATPVAKEVLAAYARLKTTR